MNRKLLLVLLFSTCLLPVSAQRLLLQQSFGIPGATAVTQDVQGNLYLATQQGQILQYSPKGNKLGSYKPDEMLYISSLQALPGLQLLAFDRNNQHLYWIDRFNTLAGSYALGSDHNPGFIDAVAAAEGNAIWLVDGSQQRLVKKQFPGGETIFSIPLNLVSKAGNLKFTYLREHKGKLYLYSPTEGLLVFDAMGNYEQTHLLPNLNNLWLDENRFYFLQKNILGYLDLQTNALVKIPIMEKATHVLVKGNKIWLLEPNQAHHYLLMPSAETRQQEDTVKDQ